MDRYLGIVIHNMAQIWKVQGLDCIMEVCCNDLMICGVGGRIEGMAEES